MTVPFILWLGFIGIGVIGSISTFIGILITFFTERRNEELW